MDLIGLITGKKDITRNWVRDPKLQMVFDFDRHTFCGERLDVPLERLQKLGPSVNRRVAKNCYLYYFGDGVEVGVEEGRFTECILVFHWEYFKGKTDPSDRPFRGRCIVRGQDLGFSADTTEQDIESAFGPPAKRAADSEDIVLRYKRDEHDYMIELTGEGKLVSIFVFAKE